MHAYRAYGLRIDSSFEIPELTAVEPSPADVVVTLGPVSDAPGIPSESGALWTTVGDGDVLVVDAIAKFLVVGGSRIVVEPMRDAPWATIRGFLLGSVIAAVLHAHERLILHASAVAIGDGAVLFAGGAGAGKSTMLAGLLARGHAMLADDKSVVVPDERGLLRVQPGSPRVRVTPATASALAVPVGDLRLQHALDKHVVPPSRFESSATVVRTVYLLEHHESPDIDLSVLLPLDAFDAVNRHTYRRRFMRTAAQRQAHFETLSRLTRHARVVVLRRPLSLASIDRVLSCVEADFGRVAVAGR